MAGDAGMGRLLLPPRDGVAAPPGAPVPGRGVGAVPLRRLPPGAVAQGPGAVGRAPSAVVRGGGVDPLPADGDARRPLKAERTMTGNPRDIVRLALVCCLLFVLTPRLRAD